MPITPLPLPPSRQDPINFSERADAFMAALPTFATEANSTAVDVDADAASAAASAVNAAASATGANASANVSKWVSGTTYAQGVVVWSPINFFSYRRKVAGAGTTDPSTDTTNWALVSGAGDVSLTGVQTLTNKTLSTGSVWSGNAVPVLNGGTGSTTATTARVALGAAASGANTDITSLTGTTTNDSASSGKIGEFISASRAPGSPLALTTNVHATLTSISLTAGDWDVTGVVGYSTASPTTNVSRFRQSASVTSNVEGINPTTFPFSGTPNTGGNGGILLPLSSTRFSLATTTTIYLIGYGLFTADGLAAYGTIQARRIR